MMPNIMERSGRWLALAVLLCGLAAIWQWVLQPVASFYAANYEQTLAERMLLGRLGAGETELLAAAKMQAARPATAPMVLVEAQSEAIALSALQTMVTGLVTRHGTRPQTTRTLPLIERDGLRLAGIQLDVRAPVETIQRVLYALETARPVLVVEQLTLEPAQREGRAGGEVRAQIQVYGFVAARKG
jgi:general secretion pathway protein M